MGLGSWLGRNGGKILSGGSRALDFGVTASRTINAIDKSLPRMEEECDCIVFGGPKSNKYDLWRLAMGIVWGKIQRRDLLRALPPPGMLLLEYNLEQSYVRVLFRQTTTYLSAALGSVRGVGRTGPFIPFPTIGGVEGVITGGGIAIADGVASLSKRQRIEVFEGPESEYKGGGWSFTSALPGAPGGLNPGASGFQLGDTPRNGFEGRVVITNSPTYADWTGTVKVSKSPTPPGDKISRGVSPVANRSAVVAMDPNNNQFPEWLVFSALSTPCTYSNNLFTPSVAPDPVTPPGTNPAPPYPHKATTPPIITSLTTGGEPNPNVTSSPPTAPQPPSNSNNSNGSIPSGQQLSTLLDAGLSVIIGTLDPVANPQN